MKPMCYLLFLLLPVAVTAQNFSWSKVFKGTGGTGIDIITDAQGNVYTTGSFYGTVDFDPGPGVFNLSQAAGGGTYISKLNALGDLVWVKQFEGGNIYPSSIGLDGAGNVYTAGFFQFTADFDPGPGVFSYTIPQNQGSHGFVSKLDPNGNFVWATRFGGDNNSYLQIDDMELDLAGNILVTGNFTGNADFDPGPGILTLTVAGLNNGYVAKISPSGNLVWAKQFTADLYAEGRALGVDHAGNVYTTGYCQGSVDFDPGPASHILSGGNSIYFSKLDASGNFVWAKRLASGDFAFSNAMEVDAAGNSFTTGNFQGSFDIDPGPAIVTVASAGDYDIFLMKLDANGQLLWAQQTGGLQSDDGKQLFVDAANNLYLTGTFQGTVDFDPGPGIAASTSAGTYDLFVSKYSSNGALLWSRQAGSSSIDISRGVTADALGGVYTTGFFNQTVDFDPGPGVYNLSSSGAENPFVWKLGPCTNSTVSSLAVSSCDSYTLNGQVYTSSGTYTQLLPNVAGCDSTITLSLTLGGTLTNESATACDSYTWEGQTYTVSGNYAVSFIASDGCDSIKRLSLLIQKSKHTTLDIAICEGERYLGYASSGTYTDAFTGSNGCDSVRTLHLLVKPKQSSVLDVTICEGETYEGYRSSGTYTDSYPGVNGCDSVRTLHLKVNPTKQTSRAISICKGATYWAGGALQGVSGLYRDTFQTILGCDSILITQLTVQNLPVPNLGPDRNICEGSMVTFTPGQFTSYRWQDQSSAPTFVASSAGTYWTEVTDENGCTQKDTVRILSILPLPANYLKESDSLCSYEKLRIQTQTLFSKYQWSTGSTQSNIEVQTPGWYRLNVTDGKGCQGVDSIFIKLKSCPSGVYIPSAFTPNNDGKNDLFKAFVHGRSLSFTLQVFERGGELVFQTTNPAQGWDGTIKGKAVPTGVLVWQCFYHLDGEKAAYQKGTVTLIR